MISWKRVVFASVTAAAMVLSLAAGSAQAVQVSTLEYEGHYVDTGNLNLNQVLTGAWTAFSGCCTLGTPDDSNNIVTANTDMLGKQVQLIGTTSDSSGSSFSPATGPPNFTGTTLTTTIDGAGIHITADFTNALAENGGDLQALWQIVKVVLKQANLAEGIFVTTALYTPTDPIQEAFIPTAEFLQFLADASCPNQGVCNSVAFSHIGALFGVSGGGSRVPEPGTLMLLGLGVVGIGVAARRKLGR